MNGTSLKSDFKHWVKQGNSVTILIIINIAVFLLFVISQFIVQATGSTAPAAFLYDNLAMHSLPSVFLRKPWGVITSAFTHAGVWHLLGNMLIFFFFGNLFRSELGNKRVVPLYLLSGFLCSLVILLVYNVIPSLRGIDSTGIGASGAVMCFVVAGATILPNLEIQLFFIMNVRIKWVAAALVFIDLVSLPHNNFGGHVAHLAGAAFGYLYVRQLRAGRDLVAPISDFFDWAGNRFSRNTEPAAKKFKPKKSPLRVVRNGEPSHASRLDQLLDKINEKGYNSLTTEEKTWLRKYSDEK
ncbi:rhomboid family intramembrane serine protease [Chitinophaga sp. GCM10012297]|uniref:Rhomboid family intramembrane serine protease n=1 Tax=Chitinophaga chungangae TaxID=2821488 RepID=A0ABS3YK28_9BACT|nr:rhomboid family intramembrane serine protease [Chitinophaga chungangae]MBO9155039.1 rhomboid family intramembrane serine protease [Chitinophaga chungangae]